MTTLSFCKGTLLASCFILAGVSCDSTEPEAVYNYSVPASAFVEGNAPFTLNLSVQRSGNVLNAHEISFALLETGSARGDDDFELTSGTLRFEKGARSAVIPVRILGDTNFELTEELQLEVVDGTRRLLIPLTMENDDEPAPPLTDEDGFLTPESYPSMQTVWADEFNGAVLNTSDWNTDLGNGCDQGICGWGNNELELYAADTSVLKLVNGKLLIRARKVSDSYFSARINTRNKKQFTFGRLDFRARLPKGKGIWPAFWMLGSSIATTPWPKCGEIDVMELVGDQPAKVHGTVHYDQNGYATSTSSTSLASGDFSEAFHVFTLVWERDVIKWYVDSQLFKTFRRSGNGAYPFNDPFYVIVNLAVGGRWPGNPDSSTQFPQKLEVDYIRVFR